MPLFAVLCQDRREDDDFVAGPFDTQQAAYLWASNDADEKAAAWNMRTGLDADGYGYLSLVAPDADEILYEWSVHSLIQP